jgi:hypothetical protein
VKDVGEYFDDVQAYWDKHGCSAEPVGNNPTFSYEVDENEKETGRGHLVARVTFPGFPDAFLHVEDWLRPVGGHIERDSYAYDLIYQGARLDNWHRHHGSQHRHDDEEHRKVPHPRVTLKQAIDRSLEILWSDKTPDD